MIYDILYEGQPPGKKRERTLRSTLTRMKKEGLLHNKNRIWSISSEGRELLDLGKEKIKKFFRPESIIDNREKPRKLIIIFDIPEKRKRYREWLRTELVGFGFNLIQKSVWFGPGLPKEFIEYLDEVGLLKHVRFFRADEKDLI